MRRVLAVCAVAALSSLAGEVSAASFPPGVTYPLKPAALQPSGLAQSLPSTRRYVLVWKDQIVPDAFGDPLKTWVVTHYVGTQKLFQRQIDDYRTRNADFLMLTYHLAYGLNGADQANPVGNITGPNTYGQEDTDSFTPWVAASGANREGMYQHSATPPSSADRVSYPDPYWLMDISSSDYQTYLTTTLLAWAAFPGAKSTGFFFDVAFPPWYNYSPASWWTGPAGGSTRQALDAWWMPRASSYFDALRAAFAPTGTHPRYLVIPNPDALIDGTDEPTFLDHTDGVFTENWQGANAVPGDWNLSARRLCHYVTGHAKVWSIDITADADTFQAAQRSLIMGTYFLIRNGTSYIMIGGGDLTWWPEYEIDLGGYVDEPPDDVETLRVAGTGGSSGGLYARRYVAGWVLVNSSSGALSWTVPTAMKQAAFSGGGPVAADGTESAQTLSWTTDVPAGALSVPSLSAVFLRDPAGAPPPGQEPGSDGGTDGGGGGGDGGTASNDGGTVGPDGGGGSGGDDGGGGNGAASGSPGSSSGCGCAVVDASEGEGAAGFAFLAGLSLFVARGSRPRRQTGHTRPPGG